MNIFIIDFICILLKWIEDLFKPLYGRHIHPIGEGRNHEFPDLQEEHLDREEPMPVQSGTEKKEL